MPADPVTIGAFGKLPCRSDFQRRGLPNSSVTPWNVQDEEWLQSVEESGRMVLESDLDPAALSAGEFATMLGGEAA